ncbi:MAG: hypothetical protein ACYSUI_09180, partial [Planctomycetota bacterium]
DQSQPGPNRRQQRGPEQDRWMATVLRVLASFEVAPVQPLLTSKRADPKAKHPGQDVQKLK